jgi:hypothetical protein
MNVSGISVEQLMSEASIGSRVANVLYFANLGLMGTNTVLVTILSRFYQSDLRHIGLPSLALLGSLFGRGQVSLNALAEAIIDPDSGEFDFNESGFTIPVQSILTAEGELLNNKELDLGSRLSKVETRQEM